MIGHGFWGGPAGWAVVAGLGLLALFLLLAVGVVLVAYLIRSRPGAGPAVGSRAKRMLEERYARGEISRDEFLERRAVLTGSPKRPPDGVESLGEPPSGGGTAPGSPGT